jgi:hypothetical protein
MPENLGGKIDMKLERIRSTVIGRDGKLVDGSISEYLKYKECQPEEFEGSGVINFTSSEIYKNYERFCKKNGIVPMSQRKLGIDMLSLGYVREKGYNNSYNLWCGNEDIANNFMRHVPNIAEEAKTNLFEGWEYSDDDFLSDDFVEE